MNDDHRSLFFVLTCSMWTWLIDSSWGRHWGVADAKWTWRLIDSSWARHWGVANIQWRRLLCNSWLTQWKTITIWFSNRLGTFRETNWAKSKCIWAWMIGCREIGAATSCWFWLLGRRIMLRCVRIIHIHLVFWLSLFGRRIDIWYRWFRRWRWFRWFVILLLFRVAITSFPVIFGNPPQDVFSAALIDLKARWVFVCIKERFHERLKISRVHVERFNF